MRVVLKPAGLLLVLFGMILLGVLAYRNLTGRKDSGDSGGDSGGRIRSSGGAGAAKEANATLIGDGISGFTTPFTKEGVLTIVPAEGVPGGAAGAKALRLTVTGKPKNRWDVQTGHDNITALAAHQALTLSFWARSPNSGKVAAIFEQSAKPFDKTLEKEIKLTPAWKPYRFDFTVPAYPAGGAALRFQNGFAPGNVVEVTGVRLEPTSAVPRSASSPASSAASPSPVPSR